MTTDKQRRPGSLQIYRRLFPFIRPYRFRLFLGILCGMLQGGTVFGMTVALYWGLGIISGHDLSTHPFTAGAAPQGHAGEIPFHRIVLTVALLPLVTVIQGILFFAGKYLVEWVGNRVVADLRSTLFRHIHSLPMQFFTRNRVGELITRITSDTGLLAQLVSNVVGDLIREPFTLLGAIAGMFYLDVKLTLIALVFCPVVALPVIWLGKKVRKASRKGQEGLGEMLSVVQETIGGALVVKAFQMEEAEIRRFDGFNNRVFKMLMRQSRARSLNEPLMRIFASFALVGVVLYAYRNNLSLALLVAFAGAMIQMYKPIKKLSQIHLRIQRAAPGVERIFEILDISNTVTDRPDAITFDGDVRDIAYRDVCFSYDGETPLLRNIDLQVKAGECIAIVGASGSGKTTLVSLLPRFFDVTSGAVEINGRDIRSYTLESLRRYIGIVTQETMLFNRTVAENIAYGSPGATREEIEDAARRANAHDFIMRLEKGYDTLIGERGSRLSGGMAQRIAIARALLRNPPILILDEATSALDTESERLVQNALNELMKNRTVFVIAHRLSTVAHADRIIVLEEGRIIEQGTHDELLARGGRYKHLYDIQFSA